MPRLLVEPVLSKVGTDLNDYWTTESGHADKVLALTPAGGMPALAGWCGYPARMSLWLLLFGLTAQRAAACPDLAVVKTGPATAAVGDLVTYTLVYTNQGALTDTSVQLTDVLPAQVSPATNSLGSGSLSGNTISWTLGSLAAGKGGSIAFQARVTTSASIGQYITNSTQIHGAGTELNTNNNRSTAITLIVASSACATCTVGYPYTSTNPLTSISFSESEVLCAFNTNVTGITDTIRAWYSDERALTLGIRRIIVKTSSGSTTNDYPITALTSNPGSVANPLVGTTIASGDQAGTDLSGRPMFPALFVTDTTPDSSSRAGDWQFGGTGTPPHAVFGTWKGAVKVVDKTHTPVQITVTPDSDPAANSWNLGNGDPPPLGTPNLGYGAEVRWNLADLKLLPGHSYRLYFMVHDGDQNKTGGDAGQACVTICVPCAPLTVTPLTNLTACIGGAATFSPTVVGGAGPYSYPYSFQWFKGASVLSGLTNSSLVLNSVSANDAGTYTVVVTGSCGSPVTNSAILTVNVPALVVTPPVKIGRAHV